MAKTLLFIYLKRVTYLSNSQVVKTYVPIDQTQHAMSSSSNSHSSAKKGVVPVVGPHFGGDQCDVIHDHNVCKTTLQNIFFSPNSCFTSFLSWFLFSTLITSSSCHHPSAWWQLCRYSRVDICKHRGIDCQVSDRCYCIVYLFYLPVVLDFWY
jgi:hypothetical protein